MSAIPQTAISLHEGILAGMYLQQQASEDARTIVESYFLKFESLVTDLRSAISRDSETDVLEERLPYLLADMLQLQDVLRTMKNTRSHGENAVSESELQQFMTNRIQFLDETIAWTEDVIEAWELSLDTQFKTEIARRMVTEGTSAAARPWQDALRESE